ncbi:MAG: AraC family transcriptional regulator [bacterium]|nr:AraC family transcriptional regulator [bacterium]
MKDDTLRIYRNRISAVLTHILQYLDRPLSLEALAVVAMFSPFHFHRVFKGQVGESVMDLVRRLKLERAGQTLIDSDRQIVSIALEAGYESHESFSRAFRTAFGESPSRFREIRKAVPPLPAPSGVHYSADGRLVGFVPISQRSSIMEGKILKLEQRRIFCLRHVGPYPEIGPAFGQLYQQALAQNPELMKSEWLAIFHDDPENTAPEKLRSDACVVIPEGVELKCEDGYRMDTIEAGSYATTRHIGSYMNLGRTWQEFVGTWIPAQGQKVRNGYCFEIYINDCQTTPEEQLITDLYEPVEPV